MASLVLVHVKNYGYEFSWENVKVLNRKFLEAWHTSHVPSNKHTEIGSTYQVVRRKIKNTKDRNEDRSRNNENKHSNNGHTRMNNNQSNSRSTEQAARQLWRNSNNSLLIEGCADYDMRKNNKRFLIKPSENKAPLKY